MALYIVKGFYEVSHYMDDGEPERFDVIHPVHADDEFEARFKFEAFYTKRTDEYSVYYSARGTDVFETIE